MQWKVKREKEVKCLTVQTRQSRRGDKTNFGMRKRGY